MLMIAIFSIATLFPYNTTICPNKTGRIFEEHDLRKTMFVIWLTVNYVVGTVEEACTGQQILTLSKMKAFADDNFTVAKMVQFFSNRVENTVGKGENAGYQHFLLFLQCFQKASFVQS